MGEAGAVGFAARAAVAPTTDPPRAAANASAPTRNFALFITLLSSFKQKHYGFKYSWLRSYYLPHEKRM
jgi:hypothetical protein